MGRRPGSDVPVRHAVCIDTAETRSPSMYKETNFELISPGESAIERSSAEEGGFPLRPLGPFAEDAPIVEHPSSEETAEVALTSC